MPLLRVHRQEASRGERGEGRRQRALHRDPRWRAASPTTTAVTDSHRFLPYCKYCRACMMLVERIRDAELAELRAHLLDRHLEEIGGPAPDVEATLRHFRLIPAGEPPDAA